MIFWRTQSYITMRSSEHQVGEGWL
uniref:Uncharacterized protein n=1 Tax=Rhizophora mucronata TaxID=61149 RepID=A0A2P2J0L9_RHIMU